MIVGAGTPVPSVAQFLRLGQSRIVSEWEKAVRSLGRKSLDRPALLEHIPELLAGIAKRLELDDPAQAADDVGRVSRNHALARLALGVDLEAVVTEYAELRRCILSLWQREIGSELRGGEIERLNVVIDDAMLESVSQFARAHQRTLEALDKITLLGLDAKHVDDFLAKLLAVFETHVGAVDMRAVLLKEGEDLKLRASRGLDEHCPGTVRVGQGFLGKIAVERVPRDAAPAEIQNDEVLSRLGASAAHGVPLLNGEGLIGVAFVGSRTIREFSAGDRQLLRALADRAATLIVRRREQEERERLYAEARKAIEVRDHFISVAAHELNNPLNALMLQIDLLLRGKPDAPTGESRIGKIRNLKRHTSRLVNLVRNLLDFSRIETGHLRLERESVDLSEIVREVVSLHEEALARAGYELALTAGEPVVGQWDRVRLEQIVTNLLSNAIKFGGGKPLEIRVAADEGTARLTVRDRGIGIAPEDQARVFESFERAAIEGTVAGLGLGLWIVQQTVRAMGGHVRLTSRLGEGSTFEVELPRNPLRE